MAWVKVAKKKHKTSDHGTKSVIIKIPEIACERLVLGQMSEYQN